MIKWNTHINAPCCPGEIIGPRYRDDQTGRWTNDRLLIQTDWDFPGTATSFGWSTDEVQKPCPVCHSDGKEECGFCECGNEMTYCDHSHTDGTIDCPECGVTAQQFIDAAREWLDNNDGATAEDPGYFNAEVWTYE